MTQYRKVYPDLWFVVDYQHEGEYASHLEFIVFRIITFNPDFPDQDVVTDFHPLTVGNVKFDGDLRCEDQQLYLGGLHELGQYYAVLQEVYKEAQLLFPWSDLS